MLLKQQGNVKLTARLDVVFLMNTYDLNIINRTVPNGHCSYI